MSFQNEVADFYRRYYPGGLLADSTGDPVKVVLSLLEREVRERVPVVTGDMQAGRQAGCVLEKLKYITSNTTT
jgi:hypothetical protein